MRWFSKREREQLPLSGGRSRVKTYSAQTGHVYQYTFAGQRASRGGMEFAFDVSRERAPMFRISVCVLNDALLPWMEARGRELAAGERYAIAKLTLQAHLDATDRIEPAEVIPGADEITAILDDLDA